MNTRREILYAMKHDRLMQWIERGKQAVASNDPVAMAYAAKQVARMHKSLANFEKHGKFKAAVKENATTED